MFARRAATFAPRFTRFASSSAAPRAATRFGVAAGSLAVAGGVAAAPIQAAAPPAAPVKTAAGTKGGIERTFIAIKPDGVQRGLVAEVINRFERKGYKLVGIKAIVPSKELAEEHYGDLKARPFYKGLVNYMTSGRAPVIAMVWEGPDVIRQGRRIIGATNPLDAEPGSIRGDYTISVGRNAIHGSDSFESATIEIGLWFKPTEVFDWKFTHEEWIISAN
ncbi:NDK-domain-containing protein [Rhizoclosmatium globosum]|uniref:Nucleoside diphosphate kinase n=1 Tax=Rhizoclosmatium globosum TaxID=329046 RepID=A0A1Y2BQM2_9FUNG|nr:NDK-domain-containing protein [Rhizoclosmatium globosum]|eukprot:ORY37052.1 NDK-domain-containing protein [Rhizoclosmatium globosum]